MAFPKGNKFAAKHKVTGPPTPPAFESVESPVTPDTAIEASVPPSFAVMEPVQVAPEHKAPVQVGKVPTGVISALATELSKSQALYTYDLSSFPMVAISTDFGNPFNPAMDSDSHRLFNSYANGGWEPVLMTANNRDHLLVILWRKPLATS